MQLQVKVLLDYRYLDVIIISECNNYIQYLHAMLFSQGLSTIVLSVLTLLQTVLCKMTTNSSAAHLVKQAPIVEVRTFLLYFTIQDLMIHRITFTIRGDKTIQL